MQDIATLVPIIYEPSEKYSNPTYIHLPIEDDRVSHIRELHEAAQLRLDTNAVDETNFIFCYFTRMIDEEGNRLTAMRRAAQFKGLLKKRVFRFFNDTLQLVSNPLFVLNNEFDFLIDSEKVHILNPAGFESIGKLQEAILNAIPQNISQLQRDLPFIDFSPIANYARTHPMAARYIASIRSEGYAQNIDKYQLVLACDEAGIMINFDLYGKILIKESDVMSFLEIIDRRRYEIELVKGTKEKFRASRRHRVP